MGITHFSGVTNVAEGTTHGSLRFQDPTRFHTWSDDFDV